MPEGSKHWVDRLSDTENREEARIKLVASASSNIFNLVSDLMQEAATVYNKRHPIQFGAGPVIINRKSDGGSLTVSIKKITEPKGEVTLYFPINSGQIEFVREPGKHTGVAVIETSDPKNGPITFVVKGSQLTVEEFVEAMLKGVLFSSDTIEKADKEGSNEPLKIEVW